MSVGLGSHLHHEDKDAIREVASKIHSLGDAHVEVEDEANDPNPHRDAASPIDLQPQYWGWCMQHSLHLAKGMITERSLYGR